MELIMLSDSFSVFMKTDEGLKRLEGFSEFNFNSGAQSYIRKYFSGKEQVDIVGALSKIAYAFDRMENDRVHCELAEIADYGLVGADAVKEFVFVDLSEKKADKYRAFMQSFAINCEKKDEENGFLNYSGQLIAKGSVKTGYLILSENSKIGEFVPERSGILCD